MNTPMPRHLIDRLAKFAKGYSEVSSHHSTELAFFSGADHMYGRVMQEAEKLVDALEQIEDERGPLVDKANDTMARAGFHDPNWNETTTAITRDALESWSKFIGKEIESGSDDAIG